MTNSEVGIANSEFRIANEKQMRGESKYGGTSAVHSPFAIRHSSFASGAFTLVELLVVMVIAVILIGSVMVASSTLISKGKIANTQAMLAIVQQAVQEFAGEQREQPTITSAKQGAGANRVKYADRYGSYPPDEMEVFVNGLPGSGSTNKPLTPGRVALVPAPQGGSYDSMQFAFDLPYDEGKFEFRDQVAMIVAIQVLGNESATILDGIQDRYWKAPLDPATNDPAVFLDRDGNGAWTPAGEDHQIRYLVDDWGVPISYMAQRDWKPGTNVLNTASSNHPGWNEASTEFIRINRGQPIIMSYGPNGKEQLTARQMGSDGAVSLVGDFEVETGQHAHKVDHPLNADNVYADPTLKERLAEGIAP